MNAPFRTIALAGRFQTEGVAASIAAIGDFLRQRGIAVLLEKNTADAIGRPGDAADTEHIGHEADLAIAIGGDGTMLGLARELAPYEVPLVGINHGRLGFGAALTARLPDGEAQLIWSDRQTGLYLADMNGDGLTDIVQVSHRAVSYWPNSGYGLFGDRVQMAHAPTLAAADAFRPDRVLLADLTGTGAADLVYAGGQELVVFLNACGNAFRDGIATGLALDRAALGRLQAADLFSSGLNVLACRCQTASGQDGFCYFDLLSGVKPYLLTAVTNPCGRQSTVAYQCATASYLADKRDGVPWVLRLPFAVFCVAATTTRDMTTGLTMTRSYRYRHGS